MQMGHLRRVFESLLLGDGFPRRGRIVVIRPVGDAYSHDHCHRGHRTKRENPAFHHELTYFRMLFLDKLNHCMHLILAGDWKLEGDVWILKWGPRIFWRGSWIFPSSRGIKDDAHELLVGRDELWGAWNDSKCERSEPPGYRWNIKVVDGNIYFKGCLFYFNSILPATNAILPATNRVLPTTSPGLLVSNARLLATNCNLPTSNPRLTTINGRLSASNRNFHGKTWLIVGFKHAQVSERNLMVGGRPVDVSGLEEMIWLSSFWFRSR